MTQPSSWRRGSIFAHIYFRRERFGLFCVPRLAITFFVVTSSPFQGSGKQTSWPQTQAETAAPGSPGPVASAAAGQQRAAAGSRPRTASARIRVIKPRGKRQAHFCLMKANRSAPGLSRAGYQREGRLPASKKPARWCHAGCLRRNTGSWEPDLGASLKPLLSATGQEESGPGLEML